MSIHARILWCLFVLAVIVAIYVYRRLFQQRQQFTVADAGSVEMVEMVETGRSILVLDMDETMIHSPSPHNRFIMRPHVHEFLREMREAFDELVVFTAATREYASPILDHLESGIRGSLFSRRFYRDSCSVTPAGLLVKDLRILGNPLHRTWILDNTPSAYALQPDRGVPISSFEGDPADTALLKIAPELKAMVSGMSGMSGIS